MGDFRRYQTEFSKLPKWTEAQAAVMARKLAAEFGRVQIQVAQDAAKSTPYARRVRSPGSIVQQLALTGAAAPDVASGPR